MSSKWHQKKAKLEQEQRDREERAIPDELPVKDQTSVAAMGGGEEQLHERKLTKEERKAQAKAKREAKKKKKKSDTGEEDESEQSVNVNEILKEATATDENGIEDDGIDHDASDALAAEGTICTFSSSRKGVDARSRDINVQNFSK